MEGEIIGGRYRIERLLGQGGMGAVYEARHTGTARRVALKIITRDDNEELLKRFKVEAKAAGLVDSEHIAQVIDMAEDEERGVPYLAMEFLDGEDLQQLVKRLGALEPELAMRIVAQALRGLERAHGLNILHRDIKPANIFVAKRDHGGFIVKLLDFGIAKIRGDHDLVRTGEQGITSTGSMMGSPLYMSPEQTNGLKKVDHRTDVFAMGVVLYEALAGRPPHSNAAGMGDLIVRLCTEEQPIRDEAPWVPPKLAAVVDRARKLVPDERFPDVATMRAELEALLPDGVDVTDDMMVAVDRETLMSSMPPAAGDTVAALPGDLDHVGQDLDAVRTTAATVSERYASTQPPPATSPRPRMVVGAVAVAAVVGLVAFGLSGTDEPGDLPDRAAAANAALRETSEAPSASPEPDAPAPAEVVDETVDENVEEPAVEPTKSPAPKVPTPRPSMSNQAPKAPSPKVPSPKAVEPEVPAPPAPQPPAPAPEPAPAKPLIDDWDTAGT